MIVFSDLDGTLLTTAKTVSAATWRALDALAGRGFDFVPCTGRPLAGVAAELLAHPAVRYVVSANGATVSELAEDDPTAASAHTIHSALLDRARALAVLDIARDYDVTFDVFADGCNYLRRDLYERLGEFMSEPDILKSMIDTRIPVDEDAGVTIRRVRDLERVSMYWKDPADRDAILSRLATLPGVDITRSYPTNIEVMAKGASKGSALAWLCAHLDLDTREAVAFGDNMNDIEMIRCAGTGVAVANAEAEVRAAADLVCATNDGDGVARTIMDLLAHSASATEEN